MGEALSPHDEGGEAVVDRHQLGGHLVIVRLHQARLDGVVELVDEVGDDGLPLRVLVVHLDPVITIIIIIIIIIVVVVVVSIIVTIVIIVIIVIIIIILTTIMMIMIIIIIITIIIIIIIIIIMIIILLLPTWPARSARRSRPASAGRGGGPWA
jgi:hypothetical protein